MDSVGEFLGDAGVKTVLSLPGAGGGGGGGGLPSGKTRKEKRTLHLEAGKASFLGWLPA